MCCDSEIELQPELHLPRLIGLCRDLPKGSISDVCIGPGELDAVEDVEDFQPHFQARAFAKFQRHAL